MESLCGTLGIGEPGARFRSAAPNHPEPLLEEPQAFQAVGEQNLWSPRVFFLTHSRETKSSEDLLLRGYVVGGSSGLWVSESCHENKR